MFPYFGAKHKLARYYPEPKYGLVIEPFAGSAAYSCFHAESIDHAILVDKDPAVVALWHRMQAMSSDELESMQCPPQGERTSEVLFALAAGHQGQVLLHDPTATRQVTERMFKSWPAIQRRMLRLLPLTRGWEVRCASYADLGDSEATWFVDPPYQSLQDAYLDNKAANYAVKAVDFEHLGRWCIERTGQLIVCEQDPADWLPFLPFVKQVSGARTKSGPKQELIFTA